MSLLFLVESDNKNIKNILYFTVVNGVIFTYIFILLSQKCLYQI